MRVCFFDDRPETFAPLTLTRPTWDLRCGLSTLADKVVRYFQADGAGAFLSTDMAQACKPERPAFVWNDPRWLGETRAVVVNGRWLPPAGRADPGRPSCVGVVGGEVAYVRLTVEQLRFVTVPNFRDWLDHWRATLPTEEAGGWCAQHPWDLVEANGRNIVADFQAGLGPSAVVSHVEQVGPREGMWIHPSARVEPLVLADTTRGPVVIDRGAHVHAFTRLEGPCYVGPDVQVLGAKIRAGTSIGPACRVGGEVEASILHGHVNKYHEGFLGHSYVGEWVNLAAGTHTSDLRCDYGGVTMRCGGQLVATGLQKVGSFIGDHTRTGLGVLLNTGSILGAFCQVFPTGTFAPRNIPSFMQWTAAGLVAADDLDAQFAVADIVMQRRGKHLTASQRELYEAVHAASAIERRQALRSMEQKALRRSA